MSEADLQRTLIDAARAYGWRVAHVRDSRGQDTNGLQDLILAKNGVVLLWELKSEKGRLTAEQAGWLVAAGQHGAVVRPRDLDRCLGILRGSDHAAFWKSPERTRL